METAGLRRQSTTHSKAIKNDEANGCARRVHFINFIIQPTEYHLLYLRIAVLVGPQHTKAIRRRILKINDFRDSVVLAVYAVSCKMRHRALEKPLDLISTLKMSNE